MLRGILQSDLFYCDHLGVSCSDEQDIANFTVRDEKGAGLLNYIRYDAFLEEHAGIMRTYMVRDSISSELVGYFSLKAGLISLNEHEEIVINEETGTQQKRSFSTHFPELNLQISQSIKHTFANTRMLKV